MEEKNWNPSLCVKVDILWKVQRENLSLMSGEGNKCYIYTYQILI